MGYDGLAQGGYFHKIKTKKNMHALPSLFKGVGGGGAVWTIKNRAGNRNKTYNDWKEECKTIICGEYE